MLIFFKKVGLPRTTVVLCLLPTLNAVQCYCSTKNVETNGKQIACSSEPEKNPARFKCKCIAHSKKGVLFNISLRTKNLI